MMANNVHLTAVTEKEESLARAIGEAHRRYTRRINFHEWARGYLFRERFYSCGLDEHHLLAAVRYIESNPVRAGIVREAWGYEWSRARVHVCIRKKDGLVDSVEMLEGVGDWKEFLRSDPSEIETLREMVRTGRPRGDDEYVHEEE